LDSDITNVNAVRQAHNKFLNHAVIIGDKTENHNYDKVRAAWRKTSCDAAIG